MSRVGQEINKMRLQKDMSPKQLAKALGVSEGFVLDIESGRKIISDDMMGRISKVLDFEIGPIGFSPLDDRLNDGSELCGSGIKVNGAVKASSSRKMGNPPATYTNASQNQPVQRVWDDAFGNILKTVPVYDYKMDRLLGKKLLPIENNKVEGHQKEKVFYLCIEDSDMAGFRIFKGDRAFAVLTGEFENDGIYFVEYNGTRAVRQVKRLSADKLLLISNKGTLVTETIGIKSVKIIARLLKLEITL